MKYLAHVKRLVDILSAFGYEVSKSVHRHVVLAGLSTEFESMITLATYSAFLMTME